MKLFGGCDACEARKDEIDHLRVELTEKNKQLELLVKRLTELSDPGIDRRLRPPRPIEGVVRPLRGPGATTPPPPTLHNDPGSNFPGYERGAIKPSYEIE